MSAKEFGKNDIKDAVKSRYAKAIQSTPSCCGPAASQASSCCGPTAVEQKGSFVKIAGYDKDELSRCRRMRCRTPSAAGIRWPLLGCARARRSWTSAQARD